MPGDESVCRRQQGNLGRTEKAVCLCRSGCVTMPGMKEANPLRSRAGRIVRRLGKITAKSAPELQRTITEMYGEG